MTDLPAGPFGCILADPPWAFRTFDGKSAVPTQGADPYATMSIADMKRLPVATVAAPDCALFMWIVGAHLLEAIDLAGAWGFAYKTDAFIWTKPRGDTPDLFRQQHSMGMGYWTRKEAESCLLFTRGKPKRIGKGVRQIIEAPRREHSRKPDETHERIQQLVGGPYLEMFAREPRDGWATWGNETDKFARAA